MRSIWERLERAAANHGLPFPLRPAATEAAIAAAERTIGLPFPADYRASLLIHDGQEPGDGADDAFDWLPGHARLAALDRVVAEWAAECATFQTHHAGEPPEEIDGGRLYHYLWHPRRIPIAGNPWWDQDNTYLDFFPGPQGTAGQVAIFGKGNFGELHGPGFGAALRLYADALDSGEWLFRDGRLVCRNKRMPRWSKYVEKKLGHQYGAPP